jgi:hypothetical protein
MVVHRIGIAQKIRLGEAEQFIPKLEEAWD